VSDNFILKVREANDILDDRFFLWDTQAAELFFIDKLWPELVETDWIKALKFYSTREKRGGK